MRERKKERRREGEKERKREGETERRRDRAAVADTQIKFLFTLYLL